MVKRHCSSDWIWQNDILWRIVVMIQGRAPIANWMSALVWDCSNPITNALELLQFCTKPSISAQNIIKMLQLCTYIRSLSDHLVILYTDIIGHQYILQLFYRYKQSGAITTGHNITWYCIRPYRDWDRTSNRVCTYKNTPYLALKGELWSVYCVCLGENWPCYNGTTM